jgi:hypothetical protein
MAAVYMQICTLRPVTGAPANGQKECAHSRDISSAQRATRRSQLLACCLAHRYSARPVPALAAGRAEGRRGGRRQAGWNPGHVRVLDYLYQGPGPSARLAGGRPPIYAHPLCVQRHYRYQLPALMTDSSVFIYSCIGSWLLLLALGSLAVKYESCRNSGCAPNC